MYVGQDPAVPDRCCTGQVTGGLANFEAGECLWLSLRWNCTTFAEAAAHCAPALLHSSGLSWESIVSNSTNHCAARQSTQALTSAYWGASPP
jgi:hypothetical protein